MSSRAQFLAMSKSSVYRCINATDLPRPIPLWPWRGVDAISLPGRIPMIRIRFAIYSHHK
ncbi:AlpA family phage regulatory protein [Citrobacter telavivensis]|uniref:AlpA family phage regulatory protein n=1 Tax=Citrobacter telavivensis TaxID=2653932 RepID=UPI00359ECDE1